MDTGNSAYRIVHAASAEALIDEADFARDERMPYWAEIWPSAIALARYISAHNLAGKRVIELGCGVGLPSIAALARGAEVLATDHYRAALDFAAYNACKNLGRELKTMLLDWRDPPPNLSRFDLILAADVLYEQRNVPALAALAPEMLTPGGEAIFADPRRQYAVDFLREMEKSGFRILTEETRVEQEGKMVKILLHHLRR